MIECGNTEVRRDHRLPRSLGPGRESVWDYPRPPAIRVDQRRVEVRLGDLVIADSRQNYRILETASPPTFYIPPHSVHMELLEPCPEVLFVSGKASLGIGR